jgi:hypothetical protein
MKAFLLAITAWVLLSIPLGVLIGKAIAFGLGTDHHRE